MQAKSFWAALILSFVATLALAAEPPPPRFPNEHISSADWETYLSEVRSVADVHCEDTPRKETYCISNSLTSAWVFTKAGHPAHPAVATGVLDAHPPVAAGILFRGYYAGDETAFRAWEAQALGNPPIFDQWTRSALPGGT
jgi:hypothetical protein